MNHFRNRGTSRFRWAGSRRMAGAAHAESIVFVTLITLVGLAGLGGLGEGMERVVAGQTTSTATHERGATPTLTSRASAAVRWLSQLAQLGRASAEPLPAQLNRPGAFRTAVKEAQEADVHETTARLREVLGANEPSQALYELHDGIDRVAYGTHAPELNRGLLGGLRRIFAGDPAVQAHVDNVLAHRADLIDNVEGAPKAWLRRRAAWLTLINHNKRRPLVMQALKDDATDNSDALWKVIRSQDVFFDQAVVGAGPLGAHALDVLSTTHVGPTRLVVDASPGLVSNNFGKVGDALRYNQSNRGQTRFGADGRFTNELENRVPIGFINPADLSFNKWGAAKDLADAAAANLRASGAQGLDRTTVTGIFPAEAGKPGRYRLALERNGETASVYTDLGLFTTGLNKRKFPGLDKKSRELIESELAKFDPEDPNNVPLIMSALDELEMAGTYPEWWNNYAFDPENPDAKIALVGGGDSTLTVIEQIDRTLGAPEISNLQRAQRGGGTSKGVEVFGGRSLPENLQEFALGLRSRYAGVLANVARAIKNREAFSGSGAETTELRGKNVQKVRITRNGKLEFTTMGSRQDGFPVKVTNRFERAVLATGVESEIGHLIDSFIPRSSYKGPIQDTNLLDVVDAQVNPLPASAIGADDRAVARKVPGEDIYFGGLAAGQDAIPESETVGNIQNRVSIALWAERLGRLLRNERFGKTANIAPPKIPPPAVQSVRILEDGHDAVTQLREADLPSLTRRQEIDLALEFEPNLALKYEFVRSLANTVFEGDDAATPVVGFQWKVNRQGNRTLEIKTNFESDEWVRALRSDKRLLGVMRKLARENQPQYLVANTYSNGAAEYGFKPGSIRPQSVGVVAGMN